MRVILIVPVIVSILILGSISFGTNSLFAEASFGEIKKLTASDGTAGDIFGNSVSVSGDVVVVGASRDDSGEGSAYVFAKDQGGTNNWGEVQKLTASDGTSFDFFGGSVAISGDVIVVGAGLGNGAVSQSGSAYVFAKDQGGLNNWGEVKELTASDGAFVDQFGFSVSISGDIIVVGAIDDDDTGTSSGSAYIFAKDLGGTDNWGEVKKLTASNAAASDRFGFSVSVSGNTIVVGSIFGDGAVSNSGSAYVFAKDLGGTNNWGEVKKLTALDAAASDQFGRTASISGDVIVVGAPSDDDGGISSGSAYVFAKDLGGTDNWGEVKKLTDSTPFLGDFFGSSVSISGDDAAVGNRQDNDAASSAGSVVVFAKDQGGTDNWGQVQKLTASDAASADLLGGSVSISNDVIIAGAIFDDDKGSASGSAYIFVSETIVKTVSIDIKPGSDPNCINTKNLGFVPLAILGSADFDVTTIDQTTLEIDDDDDSSTAGVSPTLISIKDVNGDGFDDLNLKFATTALLGAGLLVDDNELFITGETDSTEIVGSDIVNLASGPNCFD